MQLLRAFMTTTAPALSEHKEVGRMMSTFGIDLAMESGHEYLLHQVLCITALHMATLQESTNSHAFSALIEAAHHHSDTSMSSFRQNVTSIGSHNALHVFLYTAFVSIAIWARTNPMLRQYNEDLDDGFMRLTSSQWMRTARGTKSLLGESGKNVGHWVMGSPLEILLPYRGCFDPPILAQDLWAQAYQQRLIELSSLFDGRDDRVSKACLSAIKYLDECLRQTAFTAEMMLNGKSFTHPEVDIESLRLTPRPTSFCMAWIFHLSTDYLDLLDEGSSEAILLLAHYGVLVHRVPEIWTICGYGRAVVESCGRHFELVGEEAWLAWMKWPHEAIRRLDEERNGTTVVF